MRKFILIFILTLLLFTFTVFFYKVYSENKNYFDGTNKQEVLETPTPSPEVDTPSVYKTYSKESYDMALAEKRVLVLFFTANWCTDCLKQEVENAQAFAELNKEGAVGLQIHILDSETTTETDALAKKFDVAKENSFVLLDKNGAVAFKYIGEISKDLLKSKIIEVSSK